MQHMHTHFSLGFFVRDRQLGFAILTNGNRSHPHLFKLADQAMDLMKKHSAPKAPQPASSSVP